MGCFHLCFAAIILLFCYWIGRFYSKVTYLLCGMKLISQWMRMLHFVISCIIAFLFLFFHLIFLCVCVAKLNSEYLPFVCVPKLKPVWNVISQSTLDFEFFELIFFTYIHPKCSSEAYKHFLYLLNLFSLLRLLEIPSKL